MFTFIVGVIAFIFLISKINSLQENIYALKKRLDGATVSADTQVSDDADIRVRTSSSSASTSTQAPTPAPAIDSTTKTDIASETVVVSQKEASEKGEFAVGAKVLTSVGVVAFLLGVIFFLRYAFENGLISETMRIILGYVIGASFLIIGQFLRKKYESYATGLIGVGLGVFYITTFAGYAFYGFFPESIAFAGFAVITALGVFLSIVTNSLPLILFAMLGGYIVPILFPMVHSVHLYFLYLGIFAGAVLLTARFKAWPKLSLVSFLATGLLSLIWANSSSAITYQGETMFYLSILFAIFCATSFINFLVRDRDYKGIDAFLIYALPIGFMIVTNPLIETSKGHALLSLILGAFYIGSSLVLRNIFKGVGEIVKGANIMLVIGSLCTIIATALYFDGNIMIIALSAEAILMSILGTMMRASSTRIFSIVLAIIVGCIATFRYLAYPSVGTAILNRESFTLITVLLAFAVQWFLYHNTSSLFGEPSEKIYSEDEQHLGRYVGASATVLLSWIWVSNDFIHALPFDPLLARPLVWSLYALIFTAIGFSMKEIIFRATSYVIIVISVLILLSNQVSVVSDFSPVFNIRFLSALVIAFVMWLIIKMMHAHREELHGDPSQVFAISYLVMNGLLLWAGSVEISDYFRHKMLGSDMSGISTLESIKRVCLSLFWLLYASAGLAYGMLQKSSLLRKFAIALFGITIFKIFIYDTANLSDIYRFISFITLGVILLLAGFAYYRFKDRLNDLV